VIRIFIGYDTREAAAFTVLAQSILARASAPVAITPLVLAQLRDIHQRERHPLQSTDFSFSRFLVPHLSGFEGWSLFMDCDMLVRTDIAALWALRDAEFAVQVVQHDHVPTEQTKFLNQPQSRYEKKNWSSVMLFNNARCRALTPEYVDRATGLELHQFKWLGSDALIGALPGRWNHLVGHDPYDPEAAIVHYTTGGPYFPEYRHCEYGDDWFREQAASMTAGRVPRVVPLEPSIRAVESGYQEARESA
jgi:lipopolysaccharide biosynthesis glycosyltransferase